MSDIIRVTDPCFDFDKMYYLAGPMTGYENYNYPAFDKTQGQLTNAGVLVSSPHTIPWPQDVSVMDPEDLWRSMMKKAFYMLLACDGLILMRGWIASKGASAEYSLAASLKMPIYFIDDKYLIPMHDPARV